MSETKLLPCPFCGGEAELLKGTCELDNYVMCLECRTKTKIYNTKVAAVKAWNTRKPVEDVIEQLEKEADECRSYWDEFDDEDSFGSMIAYKKAIRIVKEGVNNG